MPCSCGSSLGVCAQIPETVAGGVGICHSSGECCHRRLGHAEQKNTLSMVFALAILLYLQFDETSRWRWYSWSLVVFLLALLGKSAVVMLPVVLLGCIWWTRGRVIWKDVLYSSHHTLRFPWYSDCSPCGTNIIWPQKNPWPGQMAGVSACCRWARALVLSQQGAFGGQSDGCLSEMADGCFIVAGLPAGCGAGSVFPGFLVEASDMGTSALVWARVFCRDAFSRYWDY